MSDENHLCIDLCSGLGGASQAFVDEGWDVVRVDVDRSFKPTIQADVCHLPLRPGLAPQMLLAAPPCTNFSVAGGRFPRAGVQKAMEIVGACFEAVVYLKPRFYVIENPRGYLRGLIGRPLHTVFYSDYGNSHQKLTDLWSNVPFKLIDSRKKWMPSPRGANHFAGNARKPSERAKWPLGLSQSVLESSR